MSTWINLVTFLSYLIPTPEEHSAHIPESHAASAIDRQ
jgi:hypothetical protein